MGTRRKYELEYMRRKRQVMDTLCACSLPAVKVVGGHDGVCAVCLARDAARELLCHKGLTAAKWEEEEKLEGAAKYWKQKLEFWLPNPTPGWGSLEILERRLSV